MIFRSKLLPPIIIAGLLCMCSRADRASGGAADPEFTNAYIDLLSLQERHIRSTPALEDSMKFILEKHSISQDRFLSTIHELNENPDRWEAFLQEVLDQLNSVDTTRIVKMDPMKVLSDMQRMNQLNQTNNKPQNEK